MAHRARTETPGVGGSDAAHVRLVLRRLRQENTLTAAKQADELEATLDGPQVPVALRYLDEWHEELYGRSGESLNGVSALSFSAIKDWQDLTQREVLPHEIKALLMLDTIRRNPPKPDRADV